MKKTPLEKEERRMNNIKQIEVIYDNRLVGRLALTKEGLCAFEYSAEWLGTGFSISPFELPLKSGVFILNEILLKEVLVSLMTACRMAGGYLSLIGTCNKRGSSLGRCRCWIVLPWWALRGVEHSSSDQIGALCHRKTSLTSNSWQ